MPVRGGRLNTAAAAPPGSRRGAGQHPRCRDPLVLERGERPGEHRLGDRGDRRAEHQRIDTGPLAGPLLSRRIENQIDEGSARLVIDPRQNRGRDLDEVARQLAFVPAREDAAHGCGLDAADVPEQGVRLGDHLHVAVLDAVVHHLHVVPGAVGADPLAAGGAAVHLRGDRLEDRLQCRPGVGVAARHDARAEQGAFLAPGDAGSDVENSAFPQRAGAPRRVLVVRVAAVDQDVSGFEPGREGLDHPVHGAACLDHEHHAPGFRELRDEFLRRPGADDGLAGCAVCQERVDLRGGPVVHRNRVPAARHVEHQVLAHHREPDDADVRGRRAPRRSIPATHSVPLGATHSTFWPVTVAIESKSAS